MFLGFRVIRGEIMSLSVKPALSAAPLRCVLSLAAGSILGLLTACGGGGGGAPPPPAPVNQAPTFTSAASVAVVENTGSTIHRATATDPEGAAIAFAIVGGADASRFSIAPNGELSFVSPPNFDLPTDSDLNNVYLVEIGASDGANRTNQTIAVTVSNSKEGVSVRRIATGLLPFVAMAPAGDTHLLLAAANGGIYSYDLQTGRFLFLAATPTGNGSGPVAIAAANDFAQSGRFVLMSTSFVMVSSSGRLNVEEFRREFSGITNRDPNGRNLSIPAPEYAGGGWLGFDSQGRLLIATGDAGGTGDPTGSAQNDSSRLGKLIRVDPNPDPFAGASANYWIFTNVAKGLHQPVGGFAYSSGLLIGDRGESVADEVNFFATAASGINFGWPFKEGFRVVRGTPPADAVDPVTEYARSSAPASGQGIVGGAIAGNAVASISGHYVFADRSGAIFSFPAASLQNARTATERRTADFVADVGSIEQPVGVVADSNGRVYILDADGEIFRVDAG
jgi:glucose/arabinose dehydrogenase